MRHAVIALLMCLLLCLTARADVEKNGDIEVLKAQIESLREDFETLQQRHEAEVMQMQNRIRELADQLEEQRAAQPAEAPVAYTDFQQAQPPVYAASGQRAISQIFNPDIAVIGDVLGQYTSHENEGERPDDEFIFRELELNLVGALDPFARADVTLSIEKEFPEQAIPGEEPSGEEGFAIDVEEAYLTALSLPQGLQARVGKIRERFGKANPLHAHSLPWVDYPLMLQNYFGEEAQR
ncbi:MAG: hypothetical protein HY801_04130 [Candidatus Lindowbacteria bacterium]|nr:hypothetical protein [Candidatus Lindowbacteria bacterium]